MSITQTQIINLHKIAIENIYAIAQECNEILGIVSVEEYSKVMCVPKRTVYHKIKTGKIKTINGSPCINY